jgi:hypothetical protein
MSEVDMDRAKSFPRATQHSAPKVIWFLRWEEEGVSESDQQPKNLSAEAYSILNSSSIIIKIN